MTAPSIDLDASDPAPAWAGFGPLRHAERLPEGGRGASLLMDRIVVDGSVRFDAGFGAAGRVALRRARIDGALILRELQAPLLGASFVDARVGAPLPTTPSPGARGWCCTVLPTAGSAKGPRSIPSSGLAVSCGRTPRISRPSSACSRARRSWLQARAACGRLAAAWLLCGGVYGAAAETGPATATVSSAGEGFSPFAYSLDRLLPQVDLGASGAWVARSPRTQPMRWLSHFETGFGWLPRVADTGLLAGWVDRDRQR